MRGRPFCEVTSRQACSSLNVLHAMREMTSRFGCVGTPTNKTIQVSFAIEGNVQFRMKGHKRNLRKKLVRNGRRSIFFFA